MADWIGLVAAVSEPGAGNDRSRRGGCIDGEDEAVCVEHHDESSRMISGRSCSGERLGPAISRPWPQ